MKALILVDLQNDFLPGGALAVPGGGEIIPVINSLQNKFDWVLATKDWHPPAHKSFASSHGKKPGETIIINGLRQELWPDHCIQNTAGSSFPEELHQSKVRKVFYKGIDPEVDSYSAFFDNAKLRSTGLAEYLSAQGIKEIYLAGLATDYCVKYSALDACALGFTTFVILDACRGIELNIGDIEKAEEEMKQAGAVLLSSQTLLS